MSENCSHNCGSCSSDCSSRKPADFLVPPNEHSKIKKVIAVVSGKGGVGKSMVTSTMAVLTNRRVKKQLFWMRISQALPSLRHLV